MEIAETIVWAIFIKGELYTANPNKDYIRYMNSVQKKYGKVGKIVKCKLTPLT